MDSFQEYFGWIRGKIVAVHAEAGAITGLTVTITESRPAEGGEPLPDRLSGTTFETSALAFHADLGTRYETAGSLQAGQALTGVLQYLFLDQGAGGAAFESWILSVESVD